MSIITVANGLSEIILTQLKEKGLLFVLLVSAVLYFAYKENQSSEAVYRENISLKEENKELRNQFNHEINQKLDQILSNQKEYSWHLKNNKKGGEYE